MSIYARELRTLATDALTPTNRVTSLHAPTPTEQQDPLAEPGEEATPVSPMPASHGIAVSFDPMGVPPMSPKRARSLEDASMSISVSMVDNREVLHEVESIALASASSPKLPLPPKSSGPSSSIPWESPAPNPGGTPVRKYRRKTPRKEYNVKLALDVVACGKKPFTPKRVGMTRYHDGHPDEGNDVMATLREYDLRNPRAPELVNHVKQVEDDFVLHESLTMSNEQYLAMYREGHSWIVARTLTHILHCIVSSKCHHHKTLLSVLHLLQRFHGMLHIVMLARLLPHAALPTPPNKAVNVLQF